MRNIKKLLIIMCAAITLNAVAEFNYHVDTFIVKDSKKHYEPYESKVFCFSQVKLKKNIFLKVLKDLDSKKYYITLLPLTEVKGETKEELYKRHRGVEFDPKLVKGLSFFSTIIGFCEDSQKKL